jgi:hypothetical protein
MDMPILGISLLRAAFGFTSAGIEFTTNGAAALATTVGTSTVPVSQNAYSVGVIHTF